MLDLIRWISTFIPLPKYGFGIKSIDRCLNFLQSSLQSKPDQPNRQAGNSSNVDFGKTDVVPQLTLKLLSNLCVLDENRVLINETIYIV